MSWIKWRIGGSGTYNVLLAKVRNEEPKPEASDGKECVLEGHNDGDLEVGGEAYCFLCNHENAGYTHEDGKELLQQRLKENKTTYSS